jgi:polysaccharide export outer membrane protein
MSWLPGARSAGWRLVLVLVLLHQATAARAVRAQGVFQIQPLMTTAQVYDSNLFFTKTNRQADVITRVSPGVLSEYRSPLLTLGSRYTLDVERFADHPELSGMDARQHAAVAFSYRANAPLSVTGDADYSTTHSPSELNAETGLILARARAERVAAHSLITRHLAPATAGTIDYLVTQDRIEGGVAILTHAATVGATRHLSSRGTLSADYQLHQYFFGTSSPTSHGLRFGWTRGITERSTVSIDGGPRVTDGSLTPDLSASIRYQFSLGDLSLDYARTQTTAIGVGIADTQRVGATATWRPRRSLRMQISPAFFHTVHDGLQADVYRLSVDVARQIAPGLSLAAVGNVYVQSGRFSAQLANETIPHQDVMIRLVVEPARSRGPAVPANVALPPQPVADSCPTRTYVIGPEDVLDIAVWDNAQITRTVPVRPDGKISLPLLNDMQAAGLTPMQLRDTLTEALTEYIPRTAVSVLVREVHSFKVSVIGQVKTPGRYELKDRATVLDVLAMAGGLTEYASRGRIVILREDPEGTTRQIPFPFDKLTKNRATNLSTTGSVVNRCLLPGDVVLVP